MSVAQLDEPLRNTSQVAHVLGCAPSAVIRWIQKGTLLSDGSRVRLEAIATPGGWRVSSEALDAFLAAVTTDRAGDATPAPKQPAKSSPRVARMTAELKAAGLA
jgi:hypothetical protein